MDFASSSEYVAALHLPTARKQQAPPLGLLILLRDVSSRNPLSNRLPRPVYVPPTAFLALSTVSSSPNLVGLFHPTTTSEIHSSGSSLSSQLTQLIARCVPSCSWQLSPAMKLPSSRQILPPQLQGFYPTADSLQSAGLLHLLVPDPLLSFHSHRFFFEHPENAITLSPLTAFATDSSSDFRSWLSAYFRCSTFRACLQVPLPARVLRPDFSIAEATHQQGEEPGDRLGRSNI
jgi:hypothetical protein